MDYTVSSIQMPSDMETLSPGDFQVRKMLDRCISESVRMLRMEFCLLAWLFLQNFFRQRKSKKIAHVCSGWQFLMRKPIAAKGFCRHLMSKKYMEPRKM